MNRSLDALVINLDRSRDRWGKQQEQLARLGIPFRRLRAVEASELTDAFYGEWVHRWRRPISRNEMACLASHERVWRHVVESGRPTLVLEDDALLSPRTPELLAALPLPNRPLTYNLETSNTRKLLSNRATQVGATSFHTRRIYRDRGGSAAYVLTPQAAERYLSRRRRAVALSDAFMNGCPGVERRQVMFAPAIQPQFLPEAQQNPTLLTRVDTEDHPPKWSRDAAAMRTRRILGSFEEVGARVATLAFASQRLVPPCEELVSEQTTPALRLVKAA